MPISVFKLKKTISYTALASLGIYIMYVFNAKMDKEYKVHCKIQYLLNLIFPSSLLGVREAVI